MDNTEHMVKYVVDQAVLDANPEFVEKGIQIGDELERPETDEEKSERENAEAALAEETARKEADDAAAAEAEAKAAADKAAEEEAAALEAQQASEAAELAARNEADQRAADDVNGARHPLA